jgi:capsular polysaccharide transport system permease protein
MSSIPSCWRIQRDVVFTLLLREMKTRFGKYRLGYFWAVIEPLSYVLILSMIKLFFSNSDIGGIDHPVFYTTGIIPLLFFQHCINVCLHAVDSNIGLFNYQRIRPLDAVIARVILEGVIMIATGLLVAGILASLGFQIAIDAPLGFLMSVMFLGIFSLALGLFVSVLGGLSNEIQKIIPIIIRPMFFISGIFFTIASIPQPYQTYLLLNPVLQCVELLRSSMFSNYDTPVQNFSFILKSTLIALFVGLIAYQPNRRKIVSSGTK